MKKNFFKKLSFVLVLAMIVSVLAPAAGAFAAAAPKLNSTKKYLQLSGISGPNQFDFNVINRPAGSKCTYASSNDAVATVDAASGLAVAKGTGSATVTLTIAQKGKDDVTLDATVVVRDNIETVAISNKPDKNLAVGAEWDFNRTYTTESGATSGTTSVTRWFVDKADKASITNAGLFKATEAGKYKVTAVAFSSTAKYNEWAALKDTTSTTNVLASDTFEVTVAASMTVAQKDLDTIEVNFDAPMTDVAKNIKLYSVVGTTEVAVTTIKEVKMDSANKKATINMYVNFNQGSTYVVKYPDVASVTFVAATAKVENVASVVVNTKEVVINTTADIDVSLLDANGVDLAKGTVNNTDLLGRVDYKSSSNKTFVDNNNKKLVIFTKGDETTLTATFHTYKYDNQGNEIGNLTGSQVVVGVDAASTVVGAVKAWTIIAPGTPNFNDVKQKIAVGDHKALYVQLNTATGSTTGTTDSSANPSKFKFESSDNNTLFIDNAGNLFPVKAGAVTIVVKYDDKPVDVISLTVFGERKATTMELGATDVTLSNTAAFVDSSSVSVKVKDQLGDDMTPAIGTPVKQPGSPASNIAAVSGTNVIFTGAGALKGTYVYKITANDISRFVTVVVGEPSSATPSAYNLVLGTTDADSKVASGSTSPSVAIDLFGYAGGYKTSKPSITGGQFKIVVTNPDNTDLPDLTASSFALTSVSAGAISKVKNGTYKVTAYEWKTVGTTNTWVAIDVDYFTVKDTQAHPALAEVKSTEYTSTLTADQAAQACFKVTFDGAEKTDITMGDYVGTLGGNIYVKNVKWTQTIDGLTLTHTVDVYMYITAK